MFINLIVPISVLVGLGYILNMHGHLSVWQHRGQFVTLGLVRGFAEMVFGAFCWLILLPYVKLLADYLKRILLIMCLVACISLCLFRMYISGTDLLLWVFIYGMMIMLASTIDLPDRINTMCCWLGGLNYPIFLFHYVALLVVKRLYEHESHYWKKLIFATIILVGIVFVVQVVRKIYMKCKYYVLMKKKY